MTPPRPEQPIDSFLGDDSAIESAARDNVLDTAPTDSEEDQRRSQRFRTPRDLEDLRKQLTAPRTPLLPSMDLFQPQPSSQQKSIVDTLPPMESVPPPAPYPAEPPPPRPSVVPPVRQPRSDAPPPNYPAAPRQSHAPPPPSTSEVTPAQASGSLPPPARISGLPPARSSSDFPRARLSSVPPPNSEGRGRASSFPPPAGSFDEARRREAQTIPADARSPSHLPPFDPTRPIPALRVPTFAPQGSLGHVVREHENRRIGGVAFVLLVGLLVVAGAIMGINYAAKGRSESEEASLPAPSTTPAPKVKLERLTPNAYVAPSGAMPPATDRDVVQTSPASASSSNATALPSAEAFREPVDESKGSPASPWNAKPKDANNAKNATQKPGGTGARTRKPSAAKTIDTETPLIMD